MVEIKEIDYGVACRIGNIIYINKKLNKHPVLYSAILIHELKHSSDYRLTDIFIDLKNEDLKGLKGQYYHFVLMHPKSWIEFLPGWWYNKHFIWNPLIVGLYGFVFVLVGSGGLLLCLK